MRRDTSTPFELAPVPASNRRARRTRPLGAWSCIDCGCTDPTLRYASEKMVACTDCQKYRNMLGNATRNRKHVHQPTVLCTREGFLAWIRGLPARRCTYCGIDESLLRLLNLRTTIGRTLERLGLDRVDNDGGYTLDNIVLCCFECNSAKNSNLSSEEMHAVGLGVRLAWLQRLAPLAASLTPAQRVKTAELTNVARASAMDLYARFTVEAGTCPPTVCSARDNPAPAR